MYIDVQKFHKEYNLDISIPHLGQPIQRIIGDDFGDVHVSIVRSPGKMPRKMKKAFKKDHQLKTRYGRKVRNYLKRMTVDLGNMKMQGHLGTQLGNKVNDILYFGATKFEKTKEAEP